MADSPSPKRPSSLKRVLLLFKDRKKTVLALVSLALLAQGMTITVPFISKTLVDSLTKYISKGGPAPWTTLIYAAIGMLGVTLLGSFIQSLYSYKLFRTVTKMEDDLRHEAFEKYLDLHALYHHGASSGQIIGRIERGGVAIFAILHDIIGFNLLPPLVIFIGSFIMLATRNIWVATALLVPFPIYLFAIRNISKRIYEVEEKSNEAFEEVAKDLYDVAGNVLTVKKFSQEELEVRHEAELANKARDIQYGGERLWRLMENAQTAISTAGWVAVVSLSAWLVLKGQATIGDFVLFISLQSLAYQPLWQLSNVLPRLRRNITRVERIFAILDEPVRVTDKADASDLPPLEREIEFRELYFGYHENDWALEDVSVTIPAGTTAALVGRSGSGKTTFVNLLLRSFDPQKGGVFIDGHDLRDITQRSLRRQIAVVPQEVDLFSRTIAENIAYGRPDVSREEIIEAAKTALAHDFIIKLEKGYDTIVGERGIKLSGGERQRIGIARAVLLDPKILIFDEATSHLDSESERLITQASKALVKDRTSVVIAHRLSTVLHADMIIVFKDHRIEAMGTHKELLRASPTYKKLYKMQFSDDTEEPTLDDELSLSAPALV